jgi:PAS domain-containing protein
MNTGELAMTIQDITGRKRVADALRESGTRFRALAEASPGLIWQVDTNRSAVYLNPRIVRFISASNKKAFFIPNT